MARTLRFIAACEAMGIGFWCYSGDTGIASAGYLHVVAATTLHPRAEPVAIPVADR